MAAPSAARYSHLALPNFMSRSAPLHAATPTALSAAAPVAPPAAPAVVVSLAATYPPTPPAPMVAAVAPPAEVPEAEAAEDAAIAALQQSLRGEGGISQEGDEAYFETVAAAAAVARAQEEMVREHQQAP